ncbi:MAG: hypothetical protein ACFE9D_03520 [Promethearchaeota archaeon]
MNQSSFEIGEQIQVNLVYDLDFDLMDPLGVGSISVSIHVYGTPLPIYSKEFTESGFDVHKLMTFDVSPNDWAPNTTGQSGYVHVEGWVQDSVGSMTDSVQQPFTVQRGELILTNNPLPSQVTFHDHFSIEGLITNLHNASLLVSNHPVLISVSQNSTSLCYWNLQTNLTNSFSHTIDTTELGTGEFIVNISALYSDDYNAVSKTEPFAISKAGLSLTTTSNASTIEAFYPFADNCSVLVLANLNCQEISHTLEDANVTCSLGTNSTTMGYFGPNQFSAVIHGPSTPGNYTIKVAAVAPNHDPVNSTIALEVVHRQAQINFISNRSEAAYGDYIGFSLIVIDTSSQVPITDKICSVFLYNQSVWNLLRQIALDQNGSAEFYWQAQSMGNQDFRFKVVFQGDPEFNDGEAELTVINTGDIRFICNSTLEIVRPTNVSYLVQLTTLDFQGLFNISLHLVELSSNNTWEIACTNISGYATLSWLIDSTYSLGLHSFHLIAQDGITTLGTIQLTMIIFEQTVLIRV